MEDDVNNGEHPAARAAYIHVPFCKHRCGYCNFTLVADRSDLHASYLQAIELELSQLHKPRPVDTIFLGGGTPTELSISELQQLLQLVQRWFPLTSGGEFSVEANPADINPELVEMLSQQGVNRVSLGGQSFQSIKLQWLERDHDLDCLQNSLQLLLAHIDVVSMDLIFGLPGETIKMWAADLARLVQFKPQHISTYGLTLEKGTRFWNQHHRGEFELPGESLQREMFLLARRQLQRQGYDHYEVSSYALPGFRCRHNETYWLGAPYFAAGPGAARYIEGRREINHRSTLTYLKKMLAGESVIAEVEEIHGESRAREIFVFAMRRLDGITPEWFLQQTGRDLYQLIGNEIKQLVDQGLLIWADDHLKLTEQGLLVSDSIWPRVL